MYFSVNIRDMFKLSWKDCVLFLGDAELGTENLEKVAWDSCSQCLTVIEENELW